VPIATFPRITLWRSQMTEATQYEYKATSKWCGFWGGWGSEKDIAEHIAQ
jgi:hypothetical protein